MRAINSWILAILCIGSILPVAAAKPKAPPASQGQLKKITQERDDLKARLAATATLQEDLATTQRSRDQIRQEFEALRKELAALKATMAENQSGGDAILSDLRKLKDDLALCESEKDVLKKSLDDAGTKRKTPVSGDAFGSITPDFFPARALNLRQITPNVKKVGRSVVVVNVLIGENGEVLNASLIQGVPGDGEWVNKANEACVEAAKRVVFDPARAADGVTKVRVWQGVGFLLE